MVEGGSGRSARDIWAFDGADVAHWNGSTWSRTSVKSLLPATQELNNPALTGIFEQSRTSVYAIANGQLQDEGGPLVLLHWNGSRWSRAAGGNFGFGELQHGPTRISLRTLALIPGTSAVLGGGDTHSAADPGTGAVGVIVEYQIWSARTTARSD